MGTVLASRASGYQRRGPLMPVLGRPPWGSAGAGGLCRQDQTRIGAEEGGGSEGGD